VIDVIEQAVELTGPESDRLIVFHMYDPR